MTWCVQLRLVMCLVGSHPSKMDDAKAAQWIKLGLLTQTDLNTINAMECIGVPVRKHTSKAVKLLGRRQRGKDARKVQSPRMHMQDVT